MLKKNYIFKVVEYKGEVWKKYYYVKTSNYSLLDSYGKAYRRVLAYSKFLLPKDTTRIEIINISILSKEDEKFTVELD